MKMLGHCRTQSAEEKDEDDEYGWKYLPEILLEDILAMLSPKHRHEASQVCNTWYNTFYAPRVWETFILKPTTLTRKRFDMFRGYRRELCVRKAQECFGKVGFLFKRLIVTPIENFYNLGEFMRVLGSFLVFFKEFPMPLLHTFHFTFACESNGINGNMVHGTGGQILQSINTVLKNLQRLQNLKVNQLLLDAADVPGMVESVILQSSDTLRNLEILNCTKTVYPLLELTQFNRLESLTISPQHLDDEVVLLLASSGLTSLFIVQDQYTCTCNPVSADAWKMAKDMAPFLKVTLMVSGKSKEQLLIQPHAPVVSIVFETPLLKLSSRQTHDIVHYYGRTLTSLKQSVLPRVFGSRSFHERGDSSFVMLVKNCPKLETLVINERISTATAIVISHEKKCLRTFCVRQNALIKRFDWPKQLGWSDAFFNSLKEGSRCFEEMTREVAKNFEGTWKPYSDLHFKVSFT